MKNAAQYPHRVAAFVAILAIFATIPLTGFLVVKTINLRNSQAKAAVPTIDISTQAVQKVHVNAVPQTDSAGNFKDNFSGNSFLPLGIYNPTLCQVTKSLNWTAVSGYSGEYRIKVNYGTSRSAGTYLLADINTGTGTTNKLVGNLPPSSVLHYSIWRADNNTVVTEDDFTSDSCTNTAEDTNLDSIKGAGYNLAILEKNVYPDKNYLDHSGQSGVRLLLDMRDRPNNTYDLLKDNPNVFGFYMSDDDLAKAKFYNTDSDPTNDVDVNQIYSGLKTYADSLRSQSSKIIFGASPDIDTGNNANAPWQDWYNRFDSLGNISFHYNYPKSGSAIAPWNTIDDVAKTVKHQVEINGDNRPSWFISQAIDLKWIIPLLFPTPAESRAMKYTAIVHGATGIFDFSYDGWFRRQPKGTPNAQQAMDINWWDRHAGIKANTPTSYTGGDKWAYPINGQESVPTGQSVSLWNGISASARGVNKELQQLAPIILSKTSPDDYKVFVDSIPSYQIYGGGTTSPTPIRTILKEYMGRTYLIAVNIGKTPVTAKFALTGKSFERASVLFENRTASVANNNEITEVFGSFDVNVYRLDPMPPSTLGSLVQSTKQVCNLLGSEQTAAGIAGQDGGTSLKIGNDSFWTFGDTTNSSGFPFVGNNIAKTADTDLGDCASLTPKKSGSVASALLNKLADEFLVWPDGMVNTAANTGHFFYMSVRNCQQPETCSNNLFSPDNGSASWKVRGIGLAKFDTGTMDSQRVGNCNPVINCLLWRENDGSGLNIAGATAAVDGNYVYVYLNESPDGVFQNGVRLARVDKSQIENKAAYQYYNGSGWVSALKDSKKIMDISSGFNGVSVSKNNFLGKWTAVYTNNNFNSVMMQTADNPWGPWGNEQLLFDCKSAFGADATFRCYFGRQHEEFQKNNGQKIYVSYVNQKTYKVYVNEVEFKGPTSDLPLGKYKAQYFNNSDFTDKVLEREENTAKLTGGGVVGKAPVPELTPDSNYSIRWEGIFDVQAGKYRFNASSGVDSTNVYVDDQLKVSGTAVQNALVDITQGQHKLKFEYIKTRIDRGYIFVSNFFDRTVCYDLTGDNVVNSVDQALLASKFNLRGESPWDLNGDNVVNSGDQGLLAVKFNQKCPFLAASPSPTPTPSPVPSPTPTPIAQACAINPGTVVKGGSISLSITGFIASNLPVSAIGALLTPVYSLGTFSGTTANLTIPVTAQSGLYRVRIGFSDGTFMYCTPDLAIN